MKNGLVMEGGGMRGMFVAGVCDVLMESGIEFDGAIGVSAGAAFGCNYKSGQIGRAIRCTSKYCREKEYCSFSNLIKTGDLFGAEYCYHTIPEKLDVIQDKDIPQIIAWARKEANPLYPVPEIWAEKDFRTLIENIRIDPPPQFI